MSKYIIYFQSKAKSILNQVDSIDAIVYKQCAFEALTPVKLARCIVSLINARDRENQPKDPWTVDFMQELKNLIKPKAIQQPQTVLYRPVKKNREKHVPVISLRSHTQHQEVKEDVLKVIGRPNKENRGNMKKKPLKELIQKRKLKILPIEKKNHEDLSINSQFQQQKFIKHKDFTNVYEFNNNLIDSKFEFMKKMRINKRFKRNSLDNVKRLKKIERFVAISDHCNRYLNNLKTENQK